MPLFSLPTPEVLAPAGDRAALDAAVRAGADAVYFGLQSFNARARASNFDLGALRDTMSALRASATRGYVTLNTLVFDGELPAMERALVGCADAGVDAVIVQDLGVLRLAREIVPELPVHASTQMTCTDAASVQLARDLGASRVILARELSLADIAAVRRATDVEVEVFVHGALCISYSGQCLTSEAIGGRSANRGACAQACRLPYELWVDGVKRDLGERAFLLSPGDLEASARVPELVALGVASLKIEGRLKGPEYVAATTALYRKAVDAAVGRLGATAPDDEDRRLALQAYSRGSGEGFLGGTDHQRLVEGRSCDHRGLEIGESRGKQTVRGRTHLAVLLRAELSRGDGVLVEGGLAGEGEVGGRVWSILVGGKDVARARAGDTALVWLGPERSIAALEARRRVFRTSDPARERAALAVAERGVRRLDLRLTGEIGEAPVLEGTSGARSARVTLDAPTERARGAGIDRAALVEKLGKLGDTPFTLGELTVDLPEGAHVPVSSLNRARRALIAAFATAPARPVAAPRGSASALLEAPALPGDAAPPPGGLFVLCRTLAQAEAAIESGADGVYLDFLELTGTGAAVRALRERGARHVAVAPPRIRKPGEEKIDRYLASLAPDAELVRGLGALRERGAPWPRVADFSLNVTNRLSAHAVLAHGVCAFTPAFDLDSTQLHDLLTPGPHGLAPFAEVVVHHPMPLFHMEHCAIAALLSSGRDHLTCGRPCEQHKVSLRDRAGMDHPVEADVGCRNTVFHARPQSAAELVPALQARGTRRFRIELVREDGDLVRRVVTAYRALIAGESSPRDVWRALAIEAGYGVVRGSLRVLA